MRKVVENPLVSVIVPVFNHETFVASALCSIFSQTYERLEVIVIDDGSSDSSYAVLIQLKERFNFRLLKNETNQGISATINRALAESSGEYVSLCASDDIWLPNKIECQLAFLRENPGLDLLHGNVINYYEKSEKAVEAHKAGSFPEKYAIKDYLLENKFVPLTFLIKKSSWAKLGYLDPMVPNEDFQIGYLFLGTFNVLYQPKILAIRRIHGNNLTRNQVKMYSSLWLTYERVVPEDQKIMAYPYFCLKAAKLLARSEKIRSLSYIFKARSLCLKTQFWIVIGRFILGFVR